MNERLTGTEPPDVIERHRERYRRVIDMADREGGVWWDAACGTGYGTTMLPGDDVVGFDRDPSTVKEAMQQSFHGFLVANLAQGGWSSEAPDPDVVVSVETLEHLSAPDQDGFVQEVAARLKPDGVFVVSCPIGRGRSTVNAWHIYEPSRMELHRMLFRHFLTVKVETEPYESTAGPAIQAFAVARGPR